MHEGSIGKQISPRFGLARWSRFMSEWSVAAPSIKVNSADLMTRQYARTLKKLKAIPGEVKLYFYTY